MQLSDTDKHLKVVIGVVAFYCTQQSRAPNNIINRCTPEILPWRWPWPDPNSDVKTQFLAFDLWPWPSQGQGRPSCQISRPKVKWLSGESVDWWTDGWTDPIMPILLSPCFAKATRLINMSYMCETYLSCITVHYVLPKENFLYIVFTKMKPISFAKT